MGPVVVFEGGRWLWRLRRFHYEHPRDVTYRQLSTAALSVSHSLWNRRHLVLAVVEPSISENSHSAHRQTLRSSCVRWFGWVNIRTPSSGFNMSSRHSPVLCPSDIQSLVSSRLPVQSLVTNCLHVLVIRRFAHPVASKHSTLSCVSVKMF